MGASATAERPGVAPTFRCTHCGLDVPDGLVRDDEAKQFCCEGCRAAHAIISGCGLDRYYALRDAEVARGAAGPAKVSGRKYAEFDDPVFRQMHARAVGGGTVSTELFLEGVHCAACVWLLEKLPSILPGVVEARLDLRRAILAVSWTDSRVPLSTIARAIDSLGYPVHPARGLEVRRARAAEDRRMLVRMGVAGACAGNVMLLAFALYAGLFDAIEPQYLRTFRGVSMGITWISLAWPGMVFFRGALGALRVRTVNLDVPIALGLLAGAIWGTLNTFRGVGEVYFDSLSVLVFALLVGRFIQHRQQRWSADAVELLFSLTPTSAHLVEEGGVRDVPIEAIKQGDLVEVRAGDSFPIDGAVLQGTSEVNESLLSGESRPVRRGTGDRVAAGSVNLSATLRVRVEATGEHTRVGALMRMVEEAGRRRAPIVRLADRIARWFVLGMLALALGTGVVWAYVRPEVAIENAVALLIVTCPCAAGLATPLAMVVSIGRAAGRGMLIKGADAVERLAQPGAIVLDKTGTITQGRLGLVRWEGDVQARPLVAALEAASSHPIARALVRDLGVEQAVPALDVHQTTGGGIEGRVRGRRVAVGSPAFVRAIASHGTGDAAWEAALVAQSLTPVLVAVDGTVVAGVGLGDPIRGDAQASIDHLRAAGWDVRILSGDHPQVVSSVAAALGVPQAEGGVSPEGKLARVRELAKLGPVVMVGDGVNDAAALAAAGVGVAVHGGAEASLAAADAYLSREGLAPLVELLDGSKRVLHVIHRNLGVSLFYNVGAAALAMSGHIHPIVAAILMPLSSLSVLTLSFRSRTFGGRP